ncbi:dihydrofolate reductase family protein [Microbacterium sp. M28]|uniref:dihydrofolate reductase family protein n=1 Tax=Microbacterium sp. M28 TaxID=2962064 RepID=UPI0021F40C0B|nr:dihydrofolate reductase family protein [Microbacterium sp. M28]UYO97736.1 dihydrofolate reductase family protein [Microbacterium sp. M28]
MTVRVDLNISLDGFAATADQTPEDPIGKDWMRLVAAYTATRTMQARVFGDTSGAGTTGVEEKYASAYFEGIGAEVMGAGMFGLHIYGDDPEWRGWWGEEPPFGCPVFVLTHTPRPSIEFDNGTVFHFVDAAPDEVLRRATEAAGDADVRIGGGVDVVRQFLAAGLVDRLHVAVVPVVLGQGARLWDGLRGFESDYDVSSEVAESGVTHVTFQRR